jgi:hypothetical protein
VGERRQDWLTQKQPTISVAGRYKEPVVSVTRFPSGDKTIEFRWDCTRLGVERECLGWGLETKPRFIYCVESMQSDG